MFDITIAEMVAMMFIALAVLYYFIVVARKPFLEFQNTARNRKIVEAVPALNRPYFPTPWLFNTHLQLITLGLIKDHGKALQYEQSEVLTMDDGGTVSVEWLGLDLPDNTPTMLVMHTISGDPQSMREFVRYVREQLGWRVALCVRRGHGDNALTVPSFNTMGNTEDLKAQVAHIHQRFPDSDLYATGISAGSGVLAHYLGCVGNDTPIKAAVAYCPAYDMRHAFSRAKPFYSRMMTKKLHRLFIEPNTHVFAHLPSFDTLRSTQDMHEFHQHLYELAGNASREEYMRHSNPAEVFDDIKIPILILNSKDDPVCHIDNVYENLPRIRKMDNVILVVTERGSHCAFFEGLRAKSWANRMIKEYFTAVHQLL